jgi:Protein of unknown function (DUF3014)
MWWWVALAAGVLLIAIAVFLYLNRTPPAPPPTAAPPAPPAPEAAAPAEPVIEHPVQPPAEAPAPVALDASDAPLATALRSLFGAERVEKWLFPDRLVRRFVATVDNLPRSTVSMKVRSLQPVSGSFAAERAGEELVIAPANAARYTPYVQAFERVDAKQFAGVYLRYYPWFQQAYEELGYPKAYFNDRLVAVIDHLLATPEPIGPVKLVQPKVLYQYADPNLESLSAGQKALVRMGPDNARRVKAKLRALRAEITRK